MMNPRAVIATVFGAYIFGLLEYIFPSATHTTVASNPADNNSTIAILKATFDLVKSRMKNQIFELVMKNVILTVIAAQITIVLLVAAIGMYCYSKGRPAQSKYREQIQQ